MVTLGMAFQKNCKSLFLTFLALIIAIPLQLSLPLPASAAPPEDFQTNLVVGSGLEGPSGFEIAPDGRIFILERTGTIKIVKDGQLLPTPFARMEAVASGDRGLIGIAFDPEYGIANYYVYFYYTGTDLLNHLVRYDASGDVGTNGPYEIFRTQSPSQELHVGGTLGFGSDGKLYFAVGDNGYPPNGQDLTNPHGKIMRINKDGTTPTDNPFYGQADKLDAIWAYGFRNPWRFQFDPATGLMYGGDVGDYTWEEVNRIEKGLNYGWPLVEGNCSANCAGLTDPIYAYNHDGLSSSVTGGPVYRGTMFPDEYQGSYFFGDYARGFIKRLQFDTAGDVASVHDFDTNAGSVVDMKIASDGSMYYITYYPGRLYKVTYNTSNSAPTANATADKKKGPDPLIVQFSSEGSIDPDGDPLSYLWDFGDGTTSTEANPSKTYSVKGAYTVEMQVSDGSYTSQAVPIVIQAGTPPKVTVGAPAEGSIYRAGDTITYNAHAIDEAGYDLNDGDITTDIIFHHGSHTHPFIDDLIGRANSFIIPSSGEASANTWYEIRVTATDESGLYSTESVNIYPEVVDMTYATSPAGLTLQLDGVPVTGPHSTKQVVNFERELSAPITQTGPDGITYQFMGWSDGGDIRRTLVTPSRPTTLTANFAPASSFVGEYYSNQNLEGAPTLTREDPIINFSWGMNAPAPGLPAENFSVRWTKSQFFAQGNYTFTTATDDGVRLYIDDQLVIDKWQDQGGTVWTHTMALTEGDHTIRMEYYDNQYDAAARLSWEVSSAQPNPTPPPAPISGYSAQYYSNQTLSGTPALTRSDEKIDYDWGMSAPAPEVPADNFSARWTGTRTFEDSTYRFSTTSDDGVRVYVDGQLVIDEWNDHSATVHTIDIAMSAGEHEIVIEYYENGYDAVMKFDYSPVTTTPPPPPPTSGYSAQYYSNQTLSGTPALTRSDSSVDFDWGMSAPAPEVPADNFSVRWTSTRSFEASTYRFSTTSDDGVRVYIDGELIINEWNDHSATVHNADVAMSAGEHEVIVEYYENGYDAVIKFDYLPIQGPPTPSSGYLAEYFSNQNLSGSPAVIRNESSINHSWGMNAPIDGIPADNFSVRWTRTSSYSAKDYTFSVTADDGVRLYVDGSLVIDKWIDQSSPTYTVTLPLTAGEHTVVMEYYENGYDAIAKLVIE